MSLVYIAVAILLGAGLLIVVSVFAMCLAFLIAHGFVALRDLMRGGYLR